MVKNWKHFLNEQNLKLIRTMNGTLTHRNREEVIELLSNSSNFEKEELENMTDDELVELWNSLEMDSWSDELENED